MEEDILYLQRPGGSELAYIYRAAKTGVKGNTLVFLPGYMSDMEGGKALALDAWAAEQGRAMLRLWTMPDAVQAAGNLSCKA